MRDVTRRARWSRSTAAFIRRIASAEIDPDEPFERAARPRRRSSHGFAHDERRLVGREVAAVVLEHGEVQRRDQAVGRVAGDDVDLSLRERRVEEAEVHLDAGRAAKREAVGRGEPREAVGALQELVAEARAAAPGAARGPRSSRPRARARRRRARRARTCSRSRAAASQTSFQRLRVLRAHGLAHARRIGRPASPSGSR